MKTNIPAFLNLLLCPKRVKHFKLTNTTVILSLLLEVPVSLAAPSILEKYDPLPDFSQPSTPRPAKEVAEIFYEPEDRIDRTDSFNVMYTSASYSVTDSAYISLKGSKTSEDQNVSVFHSSGGQAEFRFGRNFYLEYGSLVRTPNEPYGSVTALYAEYGGKIYADGERAKVVVLSPEPIAITAKDKSSEVIINATNNVVVGGSYIIPEFSPYFLVTAENELKVIEGKAAIELHLKEDNCRSIKNHLLDNQAHISTVFSGDSSLWFGDEHSSANANITLTSNVLHDPEGKLSVKLDVSVEDWEDGGDIPTPIIPWFAKKFSTATLLSVENDKNTKESSTYNNLDVTLENGAQWVYFGVSKTAQISKPVMLKALAREIGGFKYVDSDGSVDDKTAELDNIQLGEFTVSFRSIPKRLSSLTLNKGGIVNLSDSDAQNLSRSFVVSNPKTEGGVTSLADVWPELLTVKHNYVRFGELKSTTRGGGIFRLDINGNRNLSDMIFVEGSSTGGKHFIEIASFKDRDKELRSVKKSEDLNSLADDQKIRFATVAKDSNISFSGYDPVSKAEAPSVNYATPDAPYVTYYGNELHDITFYIGSEDYTPNAAENAKYEDRVRDDLNALGDLDAPVTAADGATEEKNYFSDSIVFDPDKQFEGGKNYYLYLLEPEEEKPDEKPKPDVKPAIPDQPYSPIAKAHFGLASWLYGTYLDRLNKRLGEVRYQNEDAGLWVRGRYNQTGDRSLDLKWGGIQLGSDFKTSENNRIGVGFEVNSGQAKLDDVNGKDNLHGFNFLVYDTWANDKGCYLDLTARLGKVHNSVRLDDPNRGRYSGDYRQSMFALGAEAGKKFVIHDKQKIFFEPQIQFQWARINGTNWKYNSGLQSGIKQANSYIGRIGARFGKEWVSTQDRPYNLYLKADLMREFGKSQKGYVSDKNERISTEWGGRKTWADIGISTQATLSKSSMIHLDLEKEIGRGMGNSWQVNANFRYEF